ncbi:MAG TPA: TonB-dependent receptor [Steroidobacter sp.]|uniref:TonB-dependent receptor n=1 Tax=Steroidobacter sp. TaxID=1978227 RepID=UPI002ED7EEA1
MHFEREFSTHVTALALLLGVAQPVNAQSSPPAGQLEEVVVTAQKRVESIQDVPLSVVAVSGEQLEAAGVGNVAQLGKLAPSLKIDQSALAAGVSVRVRGFGSPAGSATDSDVASYIDGVYIPRPGALLTSFLDVQRVEVLSGPQGTLFGRNASMGAISVTTNAPDTSDLSAEVKAEAGSYGTYSGTLIANVPVSEQFAVRFAYNASHTDGLYRNRFDGRTYGESDGSVGRISAKWNISPDVVWIIRADAAQTDGDGVYAFTGAPNVTATQIAAMNAFVTGQGGTPPVLTSRPSFHVNQAFGDPFYDDQQYGVASDLSWDIAPTLTVRLINSYRDWDNEQRTLDSVGTSLSLLNVYQANASAAHSHELQLVSAKDAFLDGKLGFTAGAYLAREDYDYGVSFNVGADWCRILRAPVLDACQAGTQANAGVSSFAQSADSVALYAQVDYAILPTLDLTLGTRYTWDEKTASLLTTTPNPAAIAPLAAPESHPALRFKDDRPSFRASLSWELADRTKAFATFSTGYKSGGFNSGVTNPPLTPALRTFDSETVDDYQLGLKSVFLHNRVRLNLTLFHTTLDNFQDRSFNGTSFIIRNSGDVRSEGVDVDGEILGPAGLRLSFAATYLDSIYASNRNAPGLEGCTGAPGCPIVQDLSGAWRPYASKWQGNVSLAWTSEPFASGVTATLRATENFTSSFLTSNTNNSLSKLPGYATTDLSLGFATLDGRWQLDLFGTNVFDKRYFVNTIAQVLGGLFGVNDPATGATMFRGFAGDPARFGVRVTFKY